MNNFLLSIGFLLIFVLSVLFAGPHFVEWNEYRHSFEAQASKIVGREVRVGGDVSLRLLPTPYVRFENVRIADQDGRFAEPFLRMNSFTMLLSVPPLLRGDVEASGIVMQEPQFHLAIDDEKGPNWKGLGTGDVALPVLPNNVAFKSVKVVDGHLLLEVADNKKLLEFSDINVDLSATAVTGPYKLQGNFKSRGELREVALVTGGQIEDNALQLRAKLTNPKNNATYDFDGLLRDGAVDPKLDGELSVVLPIFGSGFALPVGTRMNRAAGSAAELKAKLKGDVKAFKLDDLTIAFESEGRPQSLRGSAVVDWQDGLAVNSNLSAIWLDLDRIAGHGGKTARPWVVVNTMLRGIEGNWPVADKIDVTVTAEQATLGGEAINRLSVQLFKSERELRLKQLTADLPGTSNIRMSGQIIEGSEFAFVGDVMLRGRSFKRFGRWALHDLVEMDPSRDGFFALRGRLDSNNERLNFTGFKGEYEATSFRGRAHYEFGVEPRFDISIDSKKIDLQNSSGGKLTVGALGRIWSTYFSAQSLSTSKGAPANELPWLKNFRNGRLAMKVGQLTTTDELFRDVDVDLELAPEKIKVNRGQFETLSGAQFKIDGTLNLGPDVPVGKLNVIVDAPELRSVQSVARFLDVPRSVVDIAKLSPELAPFRLAGIVKLGTRDGTSTEASLDGSLGSTRATLIGHLVGAPSRWRTGKAEVVGFLKSEDGSKLLAQMFSVPSDEFTPFDLEGDQAPGRLSLRLSGVAEKGMATVVDLETPGFKSEYRGNLTLTSDNMQVEGEVSFEAQKALSVLKMVKLDGLAGQEDLGSLSGRGLVVGEVGVFQVSDGQLRLGNSEYLGEGVVELTSSGTQVQIAAKTNSISLPALMGNVVSTDADGASTAGVASLRARRGRLTAAEFSWPDQPFNFDVFERLSGSLELGVGKVDLGQGMVLGGGLIKVAFGKDGLGLNKITGKFGGGALVGSMNIKREAAGVSVAGKIQVKGADLREFKRQGKSEPGSSKGRVVRKSVAQGLVDVDFDVSGRGLSPRGVMAVLNGRGLVNFKGLTLMHFSPQAVEVASNAMLTSKRRPRRKELEASIIDNLSKGVTRLGSRKVKFKISDGSVSFDRQMIKKEGTEVSVTSYMDLNRLAIDSEWTIKPKVNIKAVLQPVSLVYSGVMSELSTLMPRIDAEQLTRELVVRKLELDVEALEALKKRDDELAREAEKARSEQSKDWGVTDTVIEGQGAALQGVAVPGSQQSSLGQRSDSWHSTVAPIGPYGSAYDPMENAAPAPAPVPKKRFVRKRKVKKKKTFNPFFQF